MEAMLENCELVSDYKQNATYRDRFFELAKRTFGIDFADWYNKSGWNENNICYSYIHDGQVVSNVSVNKLTIIIEGKEHESIQNWHRDDASQYQGLGYGKEAMKEIEHVGKTLGMKNIGLHVFGHNKVARGLYEKLGYETTNVLMGKEI